MAEGGKGTRHNRRGQPALFPSTRLTENDLRFVDRYMLHANGTRAAKEAGFSEANASAIAYQLLRKTLVRNEIDRRRALLRERFAVDLEKLVLEAAKIAFLDPREAYDEKGQLLAPHELPAHVASAVSALEVDELKERIGSELQVVGLTKKLKFWSKNDALTLLARIHGYLNDSLRHEVGKSWEEVLRGMREEGAAR